MPLQQSLQVTAQAFQAEVPTPGRDLRESLRARSREPGLNLGRSCKNGEPLGLTGVDGPAQCIADAGDLVRMKRAKSERVRGERVGGGDRGRTGGGEGGGGWR